jgi:hypothetical protein
MALALIAPLIAALAGNLFGTAAVAAITLATLIYIKTFILPPLMIAVAFLAGILISVYVAMKMSEQEGQGVAAGVMAIIATTIAGLAIIYFYPPIASYFSSAPAHIFSIGLLSGAPIAQTGTLEDAGSFGVLFDAFKPFALWIFLAGTVMVIAKTGIEKKRRR